MKDGYCFCKLEGPLPADGGRKRKRGSGGAPECAGWADTLFNAAEATPPPSAQEAVDALKAEHKDAWVLHYDKAMRAAVHPSHNIVPWGLQDLVWVAGALARRCTQPTAGVPAQLVPATLQHPV